MRRLRAIAVGLAPAVPALLAFPRMTAVALVVGGSLASAGLRRAAIGAACLLLSIAALGWRPDAFPRPTHHEHHHRIRTARP